MCIRDSPLPAGLVLRASLRGARRRLAGASRLRPGCGVPRAGAAAGPARRLAGRLRPLPVADSNRPVLVGRSGYASAREELGPWRLDTVVCPRFRLERAPERSREHARAEPASRLIRSLEPRYSQHVRPVAILSLIHI